MSFAIGLKAIKSLCSEQIPLGWYYAKLSEELFSKYEQSAYGWVQDFLTKHHALPQLETLTANFPDFASVETPEPSSYYLELLVKKFYYNVINTANVKSQEILKHNQDAHEEALHILVNAQKVIKAQKYRHKILNVGEDAKDLILSHYNSIGLVDVPAAFGWPYLDAHGGSLLAGDVVSFVGRPAAGKTFLLLWAALHNWRVKGGNVLLVSMEMSTLPLAQRVAAMYTGYPIEQLKKSGFGNKTYSKFANSLQSLKTEAGVFYIIDGNLAANVEEIYILSDLLKCKTVFIDGAYLLRHPDRRLDRYTKVAENAEWIKRVSGETNSVSFCSWQFAKTASKNKKTQEEVTLDDIGYSDAIAQVSSVILGLFQGEGIETMQSRKIQVMKGRNGEIGQFKIAWDFNKMDFSQIDPLPDGTTLEDKQLLNWV